MPDVLNTWLSFDCIRGFKGFGVFFEVNAVVLRFVVSRFVRLVFYVVFWTFRGSVLCGIVVWSLSRSLWLLSTLGVLLL